jgi:hypothetical protein
MFSVDVLILLHEERDFACIHSIIYLELFQIYTTPVLAIVTVALKAGVDR